MEHPDVLVTARISATCADCGTYTHIAHVVERGDKLVILCPKCGPKPSDPKPARSKKDFELVA